MASRPPIQISHRSPSCTQIAVKFLHVNMALLNLMLSFLAVVLGLMPVAHAATVTYDFEIGWVTANPDGMQDRPTIGINGQWPLPRIEANVGDTIIVNVLNSLGNQTTSLHFHGIYMNGTAHMDGPAFVSQCPIPSGSRFTYNFTVSTLTPADCK